MIVYNVTVKIEKDIHDDWLAWMKDNKMMKVLVDEDDGFTYSIQYRVSSWEKLDDYQKNHAPALQQSHNKKYEGKFVAFRTLLEEV